MKKVITVIGIFGLIFVQAQVGINTDTPDAGADLELGSSNKALLLNRVNSEADITTAVEGMLIFDAAEHCFKGYQNGAWVDITTCTAVGGVTALDCGNAIFNPSTAQVNTAYTGTLSISYTGGNGDAYSAQSISSTGVTGLTATIAAGTLANGAGTLEYNVSGTATSAGTASFAINIAGQNCTATINIAEAFSPTITLHEGRRLIASVFDTDYHPYTTPTVPATLATNIAANGTTNPTIDIQGKITTTGISVKIPATATGNGTLPAYSTTINIPANMTQDGISRDITLSWVSQGYSRETKYIKATIKAEVGDLLTKKLDIQTGIGSDHLGILMGTFSIPSNSSGAMVNYEVRNIAVIPDRRFIESTTIEGVTKRYHDFLYLPIVVKGIHKVNGQDYKKIWLNLNLGAEYSKYSSDFFNVSVNKARSTHTDANTYGSLFQWQRKADGHEFRNSQTTSTPATTWTASGAWDGRFIKSTHNTEYNWNSIGYSSTLSSIQFWQSGGANNPCPVGFHVPTYQEWEDFLLAVKMQTSVGDPDTPWKDQFTLPNFAAAGYRNFTDGSVVRGTAVKYFMSDQRFGAGWETYFVKAEGLTAYIQNDYRSYGASVRCVKD